MRRAHPNARRARRLRTASATSCGSELARRLEEVGHPLARRQVRERFGRQVAGFRLRRMPRPRARRRRASLAGGLQGRHDPRRLAGGRLRDSAGLGRRPRDRALFIRVSAEDGGRSSGVRERRNGGGREYWSDGAIGREGGGVSPHFNTPGLQYSRGLSSFAAEADVIV